MKRMPSKPRTSPRRTRGGTSRPSVLRVSTQSASTAHAAGLPAGALLLFGGLCLIVAGWGVWLCLQWTGRLLFTENDRFALRELEAKSDGVIPQKVLVAWSGIEEQRNLYEVQLSAVRNRLESRPIIRHAIVRRHLPGRISMTVNERVPLARLGRTPAGQNWLVSTEGILIRKSTQSKHLPFLKGVGYNLGLGDTIGDGPATEALSYLKILGDMPAAKRELLDVHDISVGHPEYLDWRLRNGYQLLMPREGDFVKALERASRMIHQNEQEELGARVLDLRPDAALAIGSPR